MDPTDHDCHLVRALIADASDNVATLLSPGLAGATIQLIDQNLRARGEIRVRAEVDAFHKIAIRPISKNEPVFKFGTRIGCATMPISSGEHVHVQNIRSVRVPGSAS